MNEIIVVIEKNPSGGYKARAVAHPISAEGETLDTVHERLEAAVRHHFAGTEAPRTIRLYT